MTSLTEDVAMRCVVTTWMTLRVGNTHAVRIAVEAIDWTIDWSVDWPVHHVSIRVGVIALNWDHVCPVNRDDANWHLHVVGGRAVHHVVRSLVVGVIEYWLSLGHSVVALDKLLSMRALDRSSWMLMLRLEIRTVVLRAFLVVVGWLHVLRKRWAVLVHVGAGDFDTVRRFTGVVTTLLSVVGHHLIIDSNLVSC